MARPSLGSKDITLDKRTKVLLGVLAAVILVGVGAFFLLSGKSSSDDTATGPVVVPSASSSKAKVTPTPRPTATPSAVPSAASVANTRDPFAPLPQEAVSASATPSPGASASPSAVATGTPTRTP